MFSYFLFFIGWRVLRRNSQAAIHLHAGDLASSGGVALRWSSRRRSGGLRFICGQELCHISPRDRGPGGGCGVIPWVSSWCRCGRQSHAVSGSFIFARRRVEESPCVGSPESRSWRERCPRPGLARCPGKGRVFGGGPYQGKHVASPVVAPEP